MTIKEATIKNFMKLKSVEMKPEGSLIVIGGRNGQGKSAILNSFMATVGGKAQQYEKPVRAGEKLAKMTWNFDTFKACLTIKENGTRELKLYKKDSTVPEKEPQNLLDRLRNKQLFDPLYFCGLNRKEQLAVFQKLLGLDFAKFDADYADTFAKRTELNKEVKELNAQVSAIPESDKELPETEVSVKALMEELERRQKHNVLQKEKKSFYDHEIDDIQKQITEASTAKQSALNKIAELEEEIRKYASWADRHSEDIDRNTKLLEQRKQEQHEFISTQTMADESEIRQQISEADTVNKKIRNKQERIRLFQKMNVKQGLADTLTSILEEIQDSKAKAIREAKFPVEKLSFDSESLIYDGLPFDQAQKSMQYIIAVDIAFKLLKPPIDEDYINVILIKDAPYLDDNSLNLLRDVADRNGGQIILEKGGTGSECHYIIEDGEIIERDPFA